MMAKMFLKLDEVKGILGKNEEEIKQLTREGRLREFRDGPTLMYKADQVEAIKTELGGGGGPAPRDTIDISDTGAPIGLVDSRSDSRGASGSGISLVDTDAGPLRGPGGPGGSMGGSGSAIALSGTGTGSGMSPLKEDTALAADLGLSGSMGGVPSPGRPGSGMSLTGTHAGHRSGITIFTPEEAEHADPSAQTNISSGVSDQINLEGVGSGSGLLDLTRESDDTSLGAELLDEIGPGGSAAGSRRDREGSGSGSGVGPVITPGRPGRAVGQPVYLEAADPTAAAFGGLALGAALFALFAAVVLMSGILGTSTKVADAVKEMKTLVLFGIGAGAAILLCIIGFVIGKTGK